MTRTETRSIVTATDVASLERNGQGLRYDVEVFAGCPTTKVRDEYVEPGYTPLPYPLNEAFHGLIYVDVSVRTADEWCAIEVNPWQGLLRDMTIERVEFREDDGIWLFGRESDDSGLRYDAAWRLSPTYDREASIAPES